MRLTATDIGSSAVEAWQYDSETRVLRVQFIGDATYDYVDVNPVCVEYLTDPDQSVGNYINTVVKPRSVAWHAEPLITR